MKENLEYQLRKKYARFKLYDVYKKMLINGRMETVFLYRTTFSTIKTKPILGQSKIVGGKYGTRQITG